VRRRRSADTRERIVAAGAAHAHTLRAWDWRELTFRAVAERAGVAESTVYRHFANERELHAAVMQRLQEESGVVYEGIGLDEVGATAARVFARLSSFAAPTAVDPVTDPAVTSVDRTRRDALLAAVEAAAPHWSPERRASSAAILDVLWHPAAYQRLVQQWDFGHDQATAAIQQAIDVVVASIRHE
jgi:AcrR family transcriptional regulator